MCNISFSLTRRNIPSQNHLVSYYNISISFLNVEELSELAVNTLYYATDETHTHTHTIVAKTPKVLKNVTLAESNSSAIDW